MIVYIRTQSLLRTRRGIPAARSWVKQRFVSRDSSCESGNQYECFASLIASKHWGGNIGYRSASTSWRD